MRCRSGHAGFSLIELLVVIAVIAVLIALLVPAVQKVRDAAARTQCQNNIRQLGIGLQAHHDVHRRFPPGGSTAGNLSYVCYLLPFIEQESIYRQMNRAVHFNQGTNGQFLVSRIPILQCPSAPQTFSAILGIESYKLQPAPTLHYIGNMGPLGGVYPFSKTLQGGFASDGVLFRNSQVKITSITDGTSNTILLGEMSWNQTQATHGYRAWMRGCGIEDCVSSRNIANSFRSTPYNGVDNFNNVSFGSEHSGGATLLFCDASTRFIREDVSLTVLMNAASRASADLPNLAD